MTPARSRGSGGSAVRRVLWGSAWQVRGPLAASIGGAVVRQAGFLAAPYLLSFAVDDGVSARDVGATASWCGLVAAAAVLQFLGMCGWDWFANLADARAGAALRTRVRAGVLGGRVPSGTGDLVVRAGRDVGLVRVWVHGLPTWAVIAVTVVVLVPGLASLDPWLLLVAVTTAPCLALLSVVYPRRFARASAHVATGHGARADVVDQIVRAAVTLRGVGAEATVVARHHEVSGELARRTVTAGGILARWTALGEGVPAIASAVGVLVGAHAVLDGRLTVGGLVTFTGWMTTVGVAVQVGLARWTQSVDAKVAAGRLDPLLSAGDSHPGEGTTRVLEARGLVVVPGATCLDLTLEPGRLVAVTGAIASGKSMLLRVLAGLEVPFSGQVLADGVPVAAGTSPTGVQYVPQRPLLMAGTVRDNLALGAASADPGHDDEVFRTALAAVGLDEELHGRAGDVLDLGVGEGGGALSGGQRQRLALARALVSRAGVLLLDDVTSAVDPATGRRLVAAVRHAARDRVVVAVGHDRLLHDEADVVVWLEDRAGVTV